MENTNDNRADEKPVSDKPTTGEEVFDRLHKKFTKLKLKEEEEKKASQLAECLSRFNTYTKNFENNLFNAKIYGKELPMREVLLEAKYHVESGLEEYALVEYFKTKYPYSSVTVTSGSVSSKCVHIVLLDEDRDKFLVKRGLKVEERMVPEYYFTNGL